MDVKRLGKAVFKEVKPVVSPDLEIARKVLEEVAKAARIVVGLRLGREYVRIIPYDKSRLEEIVTMLKTAGLRFTIFRRGKEIRVYERRSIEIIRKIIPHVFSSVLTYL